jgi:hypothetical protein
MKLTQKELEQLIDNFLKEDYELLPEGRKKSLLTEQPRGTNTMTAWRYPGVGQACKLNIAPLLMKLKINQKAASNINTALSFIMARFLGLNTWMCDIINISLGSPRDTTGDSSQNTDIELDLRAYFDNYTEDDWKATYKNLNVSSKETFNSNFLSRLITAKNDAGIKNPKAAKDPATTAVFVEKLTDRGFLGVTKGMFFKYLNDKNGPSNIIENLKNTTQQDTNFYNNVISSIRTACQSDRSTDALVNLGWSDAKSIETKQELFKNLKMG